nr:stage II sporulation protein M [Capnocytophaga catalasegens]
MEQAKKGNKYEVFILIFKNNIKGCLINILGGVLLGIVTLFNLLINGFYSAHIFYSVYKAGFSISQIVEKTLPHSFEIIGFMLSGALGFYIAWNILLLVKGKNLQVNFYKIIGTGSVIIFIIILCAAYVEAFISIKN